MDIVMSDKDPNIKLQLRKKKKKLAVSSAYVDLHTVVGEEEGENKQYIACRKKVILLHRTSAI